MEFSIYTAGLFALIALGCTKYDSLTVEQESQLVIPQSFTYGILVTSPNGSGKIPTIICTDERTNVATTLKNGRVGATGDIQATRTSIISCSAVNLKASLTERLKSEPLAKIAFDEQEGFIAGEILQESQQYYFTVHPSFYPKNYHIRFQAAKKQKAESR